MSTARPKEYQCYEPGCTKAYTQAHNLKSHRDSAHLGLKPYRCDPCARDFARKSDYAIHYQAQHCAPFSCAVRIVNGVGSSICGKQYTRRSKLRNHQMKAHGFAHLDVPRTRASDAPHEPASDETIAPTLTRAEPIPSAAVAAAEGMGDDQDMILDVLCDEMSGLKPLGSFHYLLQRLPDVNFQVLAHYAAANENPNYLKACIGHTAKLTLKNDWGRTLLYEACKRMKANNIDLIPRSACNPPWKNNGLALGIISKDYPLTRMIERLILFHGGGAMPHGTGLNDFRNMLAALWKHGITTIRMLMYNEDFGLPTRAIRLDSIGLRASYGFAISQLGEHSSPFKCRFRWDLATPESSRVIIES